MEIPTSSLLSVMSSIDESDLLEPRFTRPDRAIPDIICAKFRTNMSEVVSGFDGACYFHGTRTSDPASFKERGIWPLADMVGEIFGQLRDLVQERVTDMDWAGFRERLESGKIDDDGAFLYRLKVDDPLIGGGPYARLVRAMHLSPGSAGSDFLWSPPEIVDDIISALEADTSIAIGSDYLASTQACLVKFRCAAVSTNDVESAMWYLYYRSFGIEPGRNADSGGFDGAGERVPAESVVSVEVLEPDMLPG